MFGLGKKTKNVDKAKLERKLCLARDTPEPIFDLSDCSLKAVPPGVFSLCKVFRKDYLCLQDNHLRSLNNGGQLADLSQLVALDLRNNQFCSLTEDIQYLSNLKELYLNKNQLKTLPDGICKLQELILLDVSNNNLKDLPSCFGNLKNLQVLNLEGNNRFTHLPNSLCLIANSLKTIRVDKDKIIYPPADITARGTQEILIFLCNESGREYKPPVDDTPVSPTLHNSDLVDFYRRLEIKKNGKLKDLIAVEKEIQEQKNREFVLHSQNEQQKHKFLKAVAAQQSKLGSEVANFQDQKEIERKKFVDFLIQVEDDSEKMISELVAANNKVKTSCEWLQEEDNLQKQLCSQKSFKALQRKHILNEMETLLAEECRRLEAYDKIKSEVVKNSLVKEIEWDQQVCAKVFEREAHQASLAATIVADEVAQKAAVAVLLERGDIYTQQLMNQVLLVEQQLVVLTSLELQRKKCDAEQQVNALAEKRVTLSNLLVDLLSQQEKRRSDLLSTLKLMEDNNETKHGPKSADFWLQQYQNLLDMRPAAIKSSHENLDPLLVHEMVLGGVVHCLPFIAQCDLGHLTATNLSKVGLTTEDEQKAVLEAVAKYHGLSKASAPPLPADGIKSECVICMENECQGVLVPCGHLCTCMGCAVKLRQCPLCRNQIDKIIRAILP